MQMSRKLNLEAMTVDEMWQLHEEISRVLSVRLTSEKRELEKRLAQLRREKEIRQPEQTETSSAKITALAPRRKYPHVFPKYRNPKEPSETWSGRGKQPRWLVAAVNAGRRIDEFLIGDARPNKSRGRTRPTQ
jgi:DNA-binding protein H-NS